MRYFFCLNILFLCDFVVFAQNQTIVEDSIRQVELEVITVLGQKQAIQQFHYIQSFDNSIQSTVNQLKQSNHLYLNQQGPNLLTTAAIRGQSAQAVPVVWKNWALNSAMNGIYDISLINAFLFNKTQVVLSESQQTAGWGGAGASIQISSSFDMASQKNLQVLYQYGSFGKQQIGTSIGFHKKMLHPKLSELSNQTKIIYHKTENDFLLNIPNNDSLRQVNNALIEWGLINQTKLILTNQHQFELDIWWQKTNREIPPALGLRNTQSQQLDSALRVSINWIHPKNSMNGGLAYFNELNQYTDPFYDINGVHKIQSFKSFVEWSQSIANRLSSYSNLSYQLSRASSTNLMEEHLFRNTLQLKSHLIYRLKNIPLSLKADAVIELTDGNLLPFRPGIYWHYHPQKSIQLKGQLSRHYRLPTFNDLYWQPGGNINLQPEEGWLSELNASYQIKNWFSSITFFNNIINDEIVWQPNGSVWQPNNVAKVRNRGVDLYIDNQFKFANKVNLQIKAAYSFVAATKVESYTPNDAHLFKQLIYKPKHKTVLTALFAYQNYTAEWTHRYVGKRHTAADHSNFMAAHHLSDFTFSYLVPVDELDLQLSASIFNLFNTSYEVILKRPMPGRHFLLTSNFKF